MRPRYRILVIEDHEDARDLAMTILSDAGYHVVGAANGLEALLIANQMPFHIVVSDFAMPGMSGYDVATALGGLYKDMRFIFISGMPLPKPPPVGTIAVLAKPFSFDELLDVLKRELP